MISTVLFSLLFASALGQAVPPQTSAPTDVAPRGEAAPLADVSLHPPVVLSQVSPSYSEQARKKKVSGDVRVSLIVDENGTPQNVTVVKSLGMGLDEKAVEAVRQYRFKPATRDGVPVATKLLINVNFQIF